MSLHQSVFSFIKPRFTLSALSMLLNINGNKVNCWVGKGLTQREKEAPCRNLSFLTSHNLFLLSDVYRQVSNLTLYQILIIFIWNVVGSQVSGHFQHWQINFILGNGFHILSGRGFAQNLRWDDFL